MSEPSRYDRVRAWYAGTVSARAGTATRLSPDAWALRTPHWSASYAHNTLLLAADPGPARVLALVEEALAGLPHRHVTAYCPLSEATLDGLRDARFEVQAERLMARPRTPLRLSLPDVTVEQLDPDHPVMRALQARLWREEWLPGAEDATIAQLVDRRSGLGLAGRTVSLVVRDHAGAEGSGAAVACVDVTARDSIAEIDGLATLAAHRSRGYALALIERAIEEAADAGCELVALTALVDDWPREWYARLGFEDLGPATEATRAPGGGAT